MNNPARFRSFVADFTRLSARAGEDETLMLADGSKLLAALISHDDWLPEACAQPHPQYYQQFLLFCDS
ncbi:MAG: cysteine dioxygenase, partial [Burkholderiales bacterium]|nr:cysteine dioxygenase [Burkholderiales bacterium]